MIVQGRLILDPQHQPAPGWLAIEGGAISAIGSGPPPGAVDAGDGDCLICPGFVDAHLHLPQFESMGYGGLELLDWLDRVVYPAEAAWADHDVAIAAALRAHRQLLAAGTLGYAGYLTSHPRTTAAVVEAARCIPLRCMVGQVLMDRHAPHSLIDQVPENLQPTGHERVSRSVNPRFAVGCSDRCLAAAREHAADQAFIQTHLAESRAECDKVRELFPRDIHYAGVYDRHGLLTGRSLLAHGVHLSPDEWKLIAARNSVVVHCPAANVFLRSGLFDLRRAMEHGVRLALGSDIAAGPEIAMPRVARGMIETAKVRAMTTDPAAVIPTPAEAWRLITRGNAEALGWTDAGLIDVGAAADLLILRLPFDVDARLISRLIYRWDNSFIAHRIVNGRLLDSD